MEHHQRSDGNFSENVAEHQAVKQAFRSSFDGVIQGITSSKSVSSTPAQVGNFCGHCGEARMKLAHTHCTMCGEAY